jgi:hypothetical protein
LKEAIEASPELVEGDEQLRVRLEVGIEKYLQDKGKRGKVFPTWWNMVIEHRNWFSSELWREERQG